MLKPIGNSVLIRPTDTPLTFGSLALPSNIHEPKTRGTVVAVGSRNKNANGKPIPFTVKDGDTVIFERVEAYDPGRVDVDGVAHFLMPESKIIAIVE